MLGLCAAQSPRRRENSKSTRCLSISLSLWPYHSSVYLSVSVYHLTMTAPVAMSAKEVEASLSLLGMMQPLTATPVVAPPSPPAEVSCSVRSCALTDE